MISFNTNIDFIKKGKYFFIGSMLFILISILLVSFKGLNFGMDFTGGSGLKLEIFSETTPINQEKLKEIINSNNLIKTEYLIKQSTKSFSIESQEEFDDDLIISTINDYKNDNGESIYSCDILRSGMIGPRMASELAISAAWALGIAAIMILIYITFRFNSFFALGSIIALIHDIMIVVGIFSLFDLQIQLPIIAAFLTILGYSLNDTIVVFDRIRENLSLAKTKDAIDSITNKSINQTLSRTVLTSLTTLIVLIILYFVGGEEIALFTLALIIGVVVGTYSSIYIASFTFSKLYNKYGHLLNQDNSEEIEN